MILRAADIGSSNCLNQSWCLLTVATLSQAFENMQCYASLA